MKKFSLTILAAATLAIGSAQAQPAPSAPMPTAQPKPVATPKVMMLRVYVSNVERGERFYHNVFGTNVVQKLGDKVRIMLFPGGVMPGIILIESPEVATMHGSWVIQVPDLAATLKIAEANGGKHVGQDFRQGMQGMPAQSIHVTDPDGNLIEVLQIGEPAKN